MHSINTANALNAGDNTANKLYDVTAPNISVTGRNNKSAVKELPDDHAIFMPAGFNILKLIKGFKPCTTAYANHLNPHINWIGSPIPPKVILFKLFSENPKKKYGDKKKYADKIRYKENINR
jgi:hypothetical protein